MVESSERERSRHEICRRHANVVHHGDGRSEDEGIYHLMIQIFDTTQRKNPPQSNEGDHNRQYQRHRHQKGRVRTHRRQPHGFHPDVVHGRDSTAHEDTANNSDERTHLLPAHGKKSGA